MILIGASLLVGSAQVAAAPFQFPQDFPTIFAGACLDGQVSLHAGAATEVGLAGLPTELRSELGRPDSGVVYRLNTEPPAYLYIVNYSGRSSGSSKVCGLAARKLHLAEVADLLDLRLAGRVSHQRERTMQWLEPRDGYVATVTTLGSLGIAQVNWMSDKAQRQAVKTVRRVTP